MSEIKWNMILGNFDISKLAVAQSLTFLLNSEDIRDAIVAGKIVECTYEDATWGINWLIHSEIFCGGIHLGLKYPTLENNVRVLFIYKPVEKFRRNFKPRKVTMNEKNDDLKEKRVKYTMEHGGKIYIVENVPAKVNEETGEQYFLPKTMDKIQKIILKQQNPYSVVETPVYYFDENDS